MLHRRDNDFYDHDGQVAPLPLTATPSPLTGWIITHLSHKTADIWANFK